MHMKHALEAKTYLNQEKNKQTNKQTKKTVKNRKEQKNSKE